MIEDQATALAFHVVTLFLFFVLLPGLYISTGWVISWLRRETVLWVTWPDGIFVGFVWVSMALELNYGSAGTSYREVYGRWDHSLFSLFMLVASVVLLYSMARACVAVADYVAEVLERVARYKFVNRGWW